MVNRVYKIVFVILHYQVIEETKKCVTSIQSRLDTENYHIIVVDNKSPNGSGETLRELYQIDKRITVLLNEMNLGFACGNNVGFRYALDQLNADFIVLLNNDTYLIQDDFAKVVFEEWEYSHFAVLGPKIYTPEGSFTNPMRTTLLCGWALWIVIIKNFFFYYWHFLNLDFIWTPVRKFLFKRDDDLFDKNFSETIKKEVNKRMENVQLQGACLIFSKKYSLAFDGLDSRTFFYWEEAILYAQLLRHGLLAVYNPRLKLFHLKGGSCTNRNNRGAILSRYRTFLKSLLIYKKILNDSEDRPHL